MDITRTLAIKVLETVDAGLVSGMGEPIPGRMCVEAAVNYAMGKPHGDEPDCVSPAIRRLKIRLNDINWSSDKARANGLRRLAIAQLGSAGVIDDREFANRVISIAIKVSVPRALIAAANIQKNEKHKLELIAAAKRCEEEGTRESALAARDIARASAAAAASAASAAYAASAAAYAAYAAYAYTAADAAADAAYAADAASAAADAASAAYAASAADAAAAAASAAAYAAYAAYAASAADAASAAAAAAASAAYAYAAADAAADAAYAADAASADAAIRNKELGGFAEAVVQVLIEMKSPGCEFLDLTE